MKRSETSGRTRGVARIVLHLAMSTALLCVSGIAAGHRLHTDSVPTDQDNVQAISEKDAEAAGPAQSPRFPVKLGGAFCLVDHNGVSRSDEDFHGRYLLVFFGYANCQSMCTVGLRRIAQAVDALGAAGKAVQPVMITVEPDHDTPEVLRRELEKIHPRLLGLTGSRQALDIAYRAYRLKPELVGTDLAGNTVVSHSSYIYLMERDGTLATLFPPILSPQRMSEIIASYLPLDS
jgi:protein SCO1/2